MRCGAERGEAMRCEDDERRDAGAKPERFRPFIGNYVTNPSICHVPPSPVRDPAHWRVTRYSRSGDLVFTKADKGLSRNPSMQVFFPHFWVKETYGLPPLPGEVASLIFRQAKRQYGPENLTPKP